MTPEYVEPWLRVAWEVYRKEPVTAGDVARKLAAVGVDIQDQAFFASRVENMRLLQRAQNLIFDYLARSVEDVVGPDGEVRKALTVASRGHFTALMRDFMVKEGMATEEEFPEVNHRSLADIRSQARLELIFDTQVNLAYSGAQKAAGMTEEALRDFPAWELVRLEDRREPRYWPTRWRQVGGTFFPGYNAAYPDAPGRFVALKTDTIWAELGSKSNFKDALDVDRPPFAWYSGMGWKQISRDEWESNGKTTPPQVEPPPDEKPRSSASTLKLDPEIKRKALEALKRDQEMRRATPSKSIEEIARERARKVREELDKPWPPPVREEGDNIVMD
jgi:hypothetical protein